MLSVIIKSNMLNVVRMSVVMINVMASLNIFSVRLFYMTQYISFRIRGNPPGFGVGGST
jgi:hypothetical protein